MIKVEAVLVRAVMPDSIFVSIVGIGRGVGVVGGGTCSAYITMLVLAIIAIN